MPRHPIRPDRLVVAAEYGRLFFETLPQRYICDRNSPQGCGIWRSWNWRGHVECPDKRLSVREGAAKVKGPLRPDGLRLRDSSVQPFVQTDMGTGYLQQTPIAGPQASRNSGAPASSTARSYGWFCRGLPPGHRGLLLCPRERKVSDATYIPVTRTGGTCDNGSCRRDDERRKCELLLWQGDSAMLQMEWPQT